jgi:hypothetical protein
MEITGFYPKRMFGEQYVCFPYACFECRKSFKRPWLKLLPSAPLATPESLKQFQEKSFIFRQKQKIACPQCGGATHFMGRDFKAPKLTDKKSWEKVKRFIYSGRTYHCGVPPLDMR